MAALVGCTHSDTPVAGQQTADHEDGGRRDAPALADTRPRDELRAGPPQLCPGSTPPPEGARICRSRRDCGGPEVCSSRPYPLLYPCGVCERAQPSCTQDQDCATGEVCLSVMTNCRPECGLDRACRPRCPATSCAPDEVCQADGHCGPRPCTDGFACAADWLCAPMRGTADAHGCAPLSCNDDGFACPRGSACVPPRTSGVRLHDCKPLPCNAGGVCGVNEDCQPGEITDTSNGCRTRACAGDTDCACGPCVEGKCATVPYYCVTEPPY